MTEPVVSLENVRVFDGQRLGEGQSLRVVRGEVSIAETDLPDGISVDLRGRILSPGYVDLQVNGGGGAMFNDNPSVDTLRQIADAHRDLGVTAFLPTLITDTPEKTQAAIAATIEAIQQNLPGIVGLHLEGPHLSASRKGAHDVALIRPMARDDLEALLQAAATLPVLKITVAPESVTEGQIATLARAGVLISLGHTDADYETCMRYFEAGARCVTHLFNAMSQLGSREPGLVGAALSSGRVSAGMIADAVHIHPESMRAAFAAKEKPGEIYLISDAMAVAGTDDTEFELEGRVIRRENGTLRLADGTLAGADLDLTTAIRVLVERVGIDLERALRAATTVPLSLIGKEKPDLSKVENLICIEADLSRVRRLDAVVKEALETASH